MIWGAWICALSTPWTTRGGDGRTSVTARTAAMWASSATRVTGLGDAVFMLPEPAVDQTLAGDPRLPLPSLTKTTLKNQSFLMAVREAAEGFVTLSVCWPR